MSSEAGEETSKHDWGLVVPSSGEDGELQASATSYYYCKSQHVRLLDRLH